MKKYIKKLAKEGHALAWTIAGTALVLITLSGDTKKNGLIISGTALVIHLSGVLFKKDSE
jgi:hypothetical protein